MTTTEPRFGWPLPEDTDPLADGAAAIRSLAGNIAETVQTLEGAQVASVFRADVLAPAVQIPNSESRTIPYNVTVLDQGGILRSAGVYTVPIAGIYLVQASCVFALSAAGTLRVMTLLVGGSSVIATRRNPVESWQTTLQTTWIGPIAASQTVATTAFHNTGGNLEVGASGGGNQISICLLRPADVVAPVVPYASWVKADIVSWLLARGVALDPAALTQLTKTELLALVADLLDTETD